LNDDYCTERSAALKEIIVEAVPLAKFYDFMETLGKKGSQHKFPRVMKGSMYVKWKEFLAQS
jgi:hypothetical protein